jgi:MFS family permease
MNNPSTVPTKVFNRNFIFVMICNFGLCLGHFSVYPLAEGYAKLLDAGSALAGFLAGMFYMIALALRPVSGPIITKIDKRLLLIVIFGLGVVTNIAYALFPTLGAFAAFRVLHGIQYGFVGPVIMTLASDHTPPDKMASGLGFYGVGGAIGQSIAPMIAMELLNYGKTARTELFGYKLVFLFAALIFALSAVAACFLPKDRKTKQETKSLGTWYKNIASRHAAGVSVVTSLLIMGYALYNTFFVKFSQTEWPDSSRASVFFTVMALVLLISRPLSGFLNKTFGFKKVLLPAIIVFGTSFFIVATSRSLIHACIGAAIAALGYGCCQPSLQAMAVLTLPPLQRGVASNTLYIGMDIGLALAPTIGGLLLVFMPYSKMYYFGAVPVVLAFVILIFVFPSFYKRRAEIESIEATEASQQN